MKIAELLKSKESPAISVDPAATIRDVARRFRRENAGAIIVRNERGSLDGILTERDVAYGIATHGAKLLDLPASALATTAAVSCSPNDNVTDVARIMAERGLHHIPVRDGGRLCDVLSVVEILGERLNDSRRAARALYGMAMSARRASPGNLAILA